MPKATRVNWQPISQMPLIAGMIKESLDDTREHLGTLTKARDRPHVLDDATIDRVEQVHTEQMEFVDIYTQQIDRWCTENPSAAQARELDRMEKRNQQLRRVTGGDGFIAMLSRAAPPRVVLASYGARAETGLKNRHSGLCVPNRHSASAPAPSHRRSPWGAASEQQV